jgi:pyruvate/2-oxoglutarate dehydrogenase complex dihydrolipoamide dehydrogenase (E3) component
VIGSGQGGNPLSHALADRGGRVALIEREHLGGTCINTGCTPTKTMVASAQVAHYARAARRWGVVTGRVAVDLGRVVERKRAIVEQFRSGQQQKIDQRPSLELHRGHARFVAPHAIEVNGQTLESETIVIDTGTRPQVPSIEGLEGARYLTNATIMELTEVPRHLVVLGGGYIGLEFGQMFRRFGSRVTVVHRGSQILPLEDPDVASALQKALEAEDIAFVLDATTTRVEPRTGGIALRVKTPRGTRTISGTHLLVATGRRPNTDDLGLDKAGVAVDDRGFIKVNGRLETSVPGIWAIGDVKGGPAFTHISYNDYQILHANLDGANLTTEDRIVPYAVFTDPQVGRVGMTEKQARAAGHRLKIGTIPMSWVARAIERDETMGLMKVVVDAASDKILGAGIVAVEGGELIQALAIVMRAGLPYTVLEGAVYIHPTLAEGFYALMDAVKPA